MSGASRVATIEQHESEIVERNRGVCMLLESMPYLQNARS
jgi:hypothetical protein